MTWANYHLISRWHGKYYEALAKCTIIKRSKLYPGIKHIGHGLLFGISWTIILTKISNWKHMSKKKTGIPTKTWREIKKS